jgi:hypothetical protein
MSDPELFKYDVRVRDRMLKSKQISEEQVRAHLEALPDLVEACEDLAVAQPALARPEAERPEPALRPQIVASAPRPVPSETLGASTDEDDEDEDEDEDDEDEDEDDDDEDEDDDDEDEDDEAVDATKPDGGEGGPGPEQAP